MSSYRIHSLGSVVTFDSTIAKLYRVRGIPANYLITSDGKRVARHLRGESLERKLAELLNE